MKCKVEKIDECRVRLSVEVESEPVEVFYQEVLSHFHKDAKIAGFRDGKAPVEMVEKKYAAQVEEETLKNAIPTFYHQILEKEHIDAVSMPEIANIRYDRGKRLTFTAEVDKAPDVKLKLYKGIKVNRPAEEVTEAELDKAMTSIIDSRAEFVSVEPARAVQKGDYILADVEIWQKDRYEPGKKNALLSVEDNPNDDFGQQLAGAQINDVREITLKALPEAPGKEKVVAGEAAHPHYKVWVRAVQQKKLPVLDDVLAKEFGRDSVDLLKESVRKDMAAHKRQQSAESMKGQIFEKLLENTAFAVPGSLVDKQLKRLIEQAKRQYTSAGMSDVQFEQKRPAIETEARAKALQQVKLYFILRKVAELEKIEADDAELEGRIVALAEQTKRPADEVRTVFGDDLRESLAERKTIDFLIANAQSTTEAAA